jgi:hypothetical protein
MGFDGVLAVLAFVIGSAAVVGFPIYGWVRDKKRRGEPIKAAALLGVILVAALGFVTLGLFLLAKSIVRGD